MVINMSHYKPLDITQRVLITGAAGFIGFHLSRKLLEQGMEVIGFDNMNDYYDINLKINRLDILKTFKLFTFKKGDLSVQEDIEQVFADYLPKIVIHLAAQAGVRYSIENPKAYIDSNIVGFFHILEACRNSYKPERQPVEHLLFASSSSVYGNQSKIPFSVEDSVDKPISLYAATKKSNELMAYTYSHLYGVPMTGLRFFTVYGPYGRPDMAYFSFTDHMVKGEPIKVYNQGDMYRDFTYVDDIVQGIENMISNPPKVSEGVAAYKVYNIGNNKPERLIDFIEVLEKELGITAKKEFYPMQPGDVYQTYADVTDLMEDFDFKPGTTMAEGLHHFVQWYKEYYLKKERKF